MENDKGSERSRTKAINMSILRAVVAGYLIYLGGSLINDLLRGNSGLSPAVGWTVGLLFCISGAAFLWYSWRRWKQAEAAAAEADEEDSEQT